MIRDVIRNLDFLGDCVSTSNGGVAGVDRRIVDSTALGVLEALAGEPVVPPALLSWGAVGAIVTGLAVDVGAGQGTLCETIFRGLFFGLRGEISRSYEFIDNGLVLADTIGEHASVIAVVVNTRQSYQYLFFNARDQ